MMGVYYSNGLATNDGKIDEEKAFKCFVSAASKGKKCCRPSNWMWNLSKLGLSWTETSQRRITS